MANDMEWAPALVVWWPGLLCTSQVFGLYEALARLMACRNIDVRTALQQQMQAASDRDRRKLRHSYDLRTSTDLRAKARALSISMDSVVQHEMVPSRAMVQLLAPQLVGNLVVVWDTQAADQMITQPGEPCSVMIQQSGLNEWRLGAICCSDTNKIESRIGEQQVPVSVRTVLPSQVEQKDARAAWLWAWAGSGRPSREPHPLELSRYRRKERELLATLPIRGRRRTLLVWDWWTRVYQDSDTPPLQLEQAELLAADNIAVQALARKYIGL